MIDFHCVEVSTAAKYLSSFLDQKQIDSTDFCNRIKQLLVTKNFDHWFPGYPYQGNGFRSLSNDAFNGEIDTIVKIALKECNLPCDQNFIRSIFDVDFVLWMDPGCVSVRYGNQRSRIETLYISPEQKIQLQREESELQATKPSYISDLATKSLSIDYDRAQYSSTPPIYGFDTEDRLPTISNDTVNKLQHNESMTIVNTKPAHMSEFKRKVLERLQNSDL